MSATEDFLTFMLGSQRGLNADWCVQAWLCGEREANGFQLGVWIIDNETDDDRFTLVVRTVDVDQGHSHHWDVDTCFGDAASFDQMRKLVAKGLVMAEELGVRDRDQPVTKEQADDFLGRFDRGDS